MRSLTPFLLIGVIVVSVLGIAAVLLGVPNPLSQEKVATPEAQDFYGTHVAGLDAASKDVIRAAEFNFRSYDTDQCLGTAGGTERCDELAARFDAYVTRMSDLIAQAEALDPPSSDPTTQDWVEAFVKERREDLDGLRAVSDAVTVGWNINAWARGLRNFEENEARGQADAALSEMIPGLVDSTDFVSEATPPVTP